MQEICKYLHKITLIKARSILIYLSVIPPKCRRVWGPFSNNRGAGRKPIKLGKWAERLDGGESLGQRRMI